ncbi:MAG TPA: membrane protein insertase YidC [Bacteroidales bacterium]|nr:membrane protein insertase YidC [Bacteroidales bacterium]
MDKNTITGLALIFAIFFGFSIYNNQRTGKIFKGEVATADSLYAAGNYSEARDAYITALGYRPKDPKAIARLTELNGKLGLNPQVQTVKPDSVIADTAVKKEESLPQQDIGALGVFAGRVSGENKFYTIENNKLKLTISAKGGRIYSALLKDYRTHDSLPIVLFNGDSTVFGYNFFTPDNKAIRTNDLYFEAENEEGPIVVTDTPKSLKMRLIADNGASIDFLYTLYPDEYMTDFETKLVSMGSIIPTNTSSLVFDWKMYVPQQEKGRQNEDTYTGLKYKVYQETAEDLSMRQKKGTETASLLKLDWIAYKDQFFSTVVIADDFFLNATVNSTKTDPTSKFLRYFESEIGVPIIQGETPGLKMKLYFGPNSFTSLKKYDMGLEELVFLGRNIIRWINQFAIIPIFNFLEKFIVSYGLIIFILTLLIKIVLAPLTHRSFLSQAKMRIMKPQVDELAKKFPKQEDAMKKQQATMELYKKAGVSPMGGCLPMLLQMPILFAMFRFFPTSIELRQQPFLWAHDLSTYDSILNLPFSIPMYGDHVSLFTLLMTVSTIISTKMTNPVGGTEQMPGMKAMMYMMPVMFMLILNNFSAGLTYYYFLANVISIAQTEISKRFVNEKDLMKKIEENRKKPVKKSTWQARLEAAAKQKGYKPAKK